MALYPQLMGTWCWAATREMITGYFGNPITQCRQLDDAYSVDCPCNQCVTNDSVPTCLKDGWPDFHRYGLDFQQTPDDAPDDRSALTWADLLRQFAGGPTGRGAPVAFSWRWPTRTSGKEGGGHIMVAKGYLIDEEGDRWVEMADPANPDTPCAGRVEYIRYEYYVSYAGHHTHWRDYYDIAPLGDRRESGE